MSESKCPFHGSITKPNVGTENNNWWPNQLNIDSLIEKVKNSEISELIFALSATMEGDTTNFYIYRLLNDHKITITTIARGVSVGNELEYTDEVTLGRSIIKRIPFENSLKNVN